MAINSQGFSWNSRNDVGTSPVICYYLSYSETARTSTSATYRVDVVAGFIPEATSSTYYTYSTSWSISINGISSPSFASFSDTWTGDDSKYNDSYGFQVMGSGSVSLTVPGVPSSAGNLSFSFISTGNGFGTSGDDCTLTNTVNLSSSNTAPDIPSINFPNAKGETVTITVTSTVSDGDSMRRTIQLAPYEVDGSIRETSIREICNYDTDIHGWEPSGKDDSYDITFSNYYGDWVRGRGFAFRAKSKESSGGLESGWSEWFGTHIWNTIPTAPTSILSFYRSYWTEIPLSWSGATDADGDILHYALQVSHDHTTYTDVILASSNHTSTSYTYIIPETDPVKTVYYFRVKAIDPDGKESGWYDEMDPVYKNHPPAAPASVWTSEQYSEFGTTINWTPSTDADGDTVYYLINIYKNSVLFIESYGFLFTGTSRYYEFPQDTPIGTVFTFEVYADDGWYGKSSKTKGGKCTKQSKPPSPTVLYPLPPTVYDTTPRIAVSINKESNNNNQKLYVTWKGVEYNNVDNPTLFSVNTFTLVETNVVIFKPSVAGAYGSSTIKVRTSNGYLYSDYVDHTINITDISTLTVAAGDIIKAAHILNLRSAVSGVSTAYGQTALPVISLSSSDKIDLTEINEIETKISSLTTVLNSLDSTNTKFDKTITWTTSEVFINNKYLEEIKSKLIDL